MPLSGFLSHRGTHEWTENEKCEDWSACESNICLHKQMSTPHGLSTQLASLTVYSRSLVCVYMSGAGSGWYAHFNSCRPCVFFIKKFYSNVFICPIHSVIISSDYPNNNIHNMQFHESHFNSFLPIPMHKQIAVHISSKAALEHTTTMRRYIFNMPCWQKHTSISFVSLSHGPTTARHTTNAQRMRNVTIASMRNRPLVIVTKRRCRSARASTWFCLRHLPCSCACRGRTFSICPFRFNIASQQSPLFYFMHFNLYSYLNPIADLILIQFTSMSSSQLPNHWPFYIWF